MKSHLLHIIRLMPFLMLFSLLSSCHTGQAKNRSPKPDGKGSFDQWVASVHSFPYTAPAERQKQIRDNFSKLSLGLTKTQVEMLLGEPDYSRVSARKGFNPEYIGSSWKYVFYDDDPNLVNEKTENRIGVSFDMNDCVYWVAPVNIDGLSDIGGLGVKLQPDKSDN